MNEEYMTIVMGLIMHGGNAKGLAFTAIQEAKEGKFDEAEKLLKESNKELLEAHHTQTEMLTQEAQGQKTEINLYMVHAQDHLMNAITFKDLATEIIEQEKRIQKLEAK
ncbi:MAG: PTS lactose/cellobiose transporter subunit IIA [Streptococcaceae bacterium]|nr:PTS lactose/cellobiose transporter subunit IIA [Streptococcaceae bacterium]MCL2681271.1 PTS lactose/cellobiose transporter subunit IIA [Streptococcaceae bacterium]MCL2858906.1 PTS lactose/cellobiose transporter subunit IIA [Streptococcaceae bacterium]